MAEINISSEKGAALIIVHPDGSTDVWSIPTNAQVTVQGQRGFGDAEVILEDVPMSNSLDSAKSIIGQVGAQ